MAQQVGGNPDRQVLKDLLAQAGHELDLLSGRSYRPARNVTSVFMPNGLPFVDVPDAQVGSMEPATGPWPIPDPVNQQMAAVLQVSPFYASSDRGISC
ncbi:hypothetical protein [Pseudonocardia adelaidensis]